MSSTQPQPNAAWLDLLDWRRQMSVIYAEVRRLSLSDPRAAHAYWQRERNRLFKTHPQTPLSDPAAFTALPVWDYDPALRFTAPVDTSVEPLSFTIPSSTGQDMPLVRFGRVNFALGSLDVFWIDVYGGGVFLPFKDATSGTQSYGGGRYLLDTAKSADLGSVGSELVLDFNFAYHPSCFYNPHWSCPLAPPSNVLKVAVEAGERA